MRHLRAFLFGSFAVAVVAWAGLTALAVGLQSTGHALHAHLGPLVFISVSRGADGTETTFGPGLLGLVVVGGLANAVAAGIVARRTRGGPPIA